MDKKLYFQKDGTFKLMQLTDLHFERGTLHGKKTLDLIRNLIQTEKPDFIINTGDTVYGEHNTEDFPIAMAPVLESGIPWAFTFGNHDAEYLGNKKELFESILKLPNCMTWHDESSADGSGNCYFELCGKEGPPQWLIFAVDSEGKMPPPHVGGYGYVSEKQIQWFRKVMKAREEKGSSFSAMIFMHIALQEHLEVWKHEITYGSKRDGCGHARINSGFYSAMLETGHTKGVFAGHDHVNDYWGYLYGIALGYGRMSGFGSYSAQDFLKGCRIFCFRDGNTESFETYERLEHQIIMNEPWTQHPLVQRDEG